MSIHRWGKPIKNMKARDPRYFLQEGQGPSLQELGMQQWIEAMLNQPLGTTTDYDSFSAGPRSEEPSTTYASQIERGEDPATIRDELLSKALDQGGSQEEFDDVFNYAVQATVDIVQGLNESIYHLNEEEDFTMRTDAQGGGRREWKDLVGNLASRLRDHWFYKVKPTGTPLAEWASSSDPKKDEVVREWLMGYPNWFGTGENTPLDDPTVQDALQQAIPLAVKTAEAAEPKAVDVDEYGWSHEPSFPKESKRYSSDKRLQTHFDAFNKFLNESIHKRYSSDERLQTHFDAFDKFLNEDEDEPAGGTKAKAKLKRKIL